MMNPIVNTITPEHVAISDLYISSELDNVSTENKENCGVYACCMSKTLPEVKGFPALKNQKHGKDQAKCRPDSHSMGCCEYAEHGNIQC